MISTRMLLEKVRLDDSNVDAGRVGVISRDLEEVLGKSFDEPIPDVKDLRVRYACWLAKTARPGTTVRNLCWRLGVILRLAEEQGLATPPSPRFDSGFPLPPRPSGSAPALRRHKALVRFEGWCAECEVPFAKVDEGTFRRYRDWLMESRAAKQAAGTEALYSDLCRVWRELAAKGRVHNVDLPRWNDGAPPRYGLPRTAWPAKIEEDFRQIIRAAKTTSDGSTRHLKKPLRRASLKVIEALLRRLFGYAVHIEGVGIADACLRDVLSNQALVLRYYTWHSKERCGGEEREYHRSELRKLADLLEWLEGPASAVEALRAGARSLKTVRARDPFPVKPVTYGELVLAAQRAMADATAGWNQAVTGKKRRAIITAACAYRDAVALSLLVCRPMRSRNMVEMQLGGNLLLWLDAGGTISFEDHEMKTREFECPVPPQLVGPLRRLTSEVVPALTGRQDCSFVFPTKAGRQLTAGDFWKRMTAMGAKYLNLQTNPHMFRSLVACAYIIEHPDRWRDVQAVLGHTRINTTLRSYMRAYSQISSRRVAELQRIHCPHMTKLGQLFPAVLPVERPPVPRGADR